MNPCAFTVGTLLAAHTAARRRWAAQDDILETDIAGGHQ